MRISISLAAAAFLASSASVTAIPVQLDASAACPAVELISARGTTEPQIPGSYVLNRGPLAAIARQIPDTAIYNVVYPADTNFNTGPIIGANDLLARLNSRIVACPSTNFVLAGFSQGAMVVQRALPKIPAAAASKIKAVIMFGNPNFDASGPCADGTAKGRGHRGTPIPAEWQPKLRDYCNSGDPVCADGSNWLVHAAYGNGAAANKAVNFVVSLL
ncbi:cutinase [Powellomyces hirtus]|nr:cutinase [Powellomyces hirtus]